MSCTESNTVEQMNRELRRSFHLSRIRYKKTWGGKFHAPCLEGLRSCLSQASASTVQVELPWRSSFHEPSPLTDLAATIWFWMRDS